MTKLEQRYAQALEKANQIECKLKLDEKRKAEKQRKIDNKRKFMVGEAVLSSYPKLGNIDLKSTDEEIIESIKTLLNESK